MESPRTDRRWLVLSALLGIAVAAIVGWLLLAFVPFSKHVRQSMVPYEAAIGLGILAGLAMAQVRVPRLKVRLGQLALSFGLAAVLVGVVLWTVPKGLHRRQFPSWIPGLAGAGLGLWIVAWVTERLKKRRIWTFTALIFGVALASVTLQVGQYQYKAFAGERVRAWNVFHYYVGSKYFGELSYFDLYAATLTADDDWQAYKEQIKGKKKKKRYSKRKDFKKIKRARDQHDYQNKPRAEIVASFDRGKLSKERLKELGQDTRFIRKYMGFGNPGWAQCFTDLGYNPAPPWTVVGTPLSNVVPSSFPGFWVIVNSDVPLYILTFLLIWWAFGLRVASIMATWLTTAQLNEARFTGGFLQYDWMCSVLCSLALFRKGRHKLSGVALSWGAMTRVFPGFLIFGIVLKVLVDLLGLGSRGRSEGAGLQHRGPLARVKPAHWNFLLAFTMACGVLFVGSHFTGRGLDTWPEWADKIGRHSSYHAVTSNMRMGVGRLAIHKPRPGKFWADATGGKQAKLDQGKTRKHIYQGIGMVLLLLALFRRRDTDAFILMLFAVFCMVVLSRYYASIWAMVFVLGIGPPRGDPDAPPAWKMIGWQGLFAGSVLLGINTFYYALGGTTPAYYILNYCIYTMFVVLCLSWIVGDVRAWRRRRAAGPSGEVVPAQVGVPAEAGGPSGIVAGQA